MSFENESMDVLWSGERKSLTSQATGGRLASAHYKLTHSHLIFEAGLMSTNEERVPLWALGDVDLKQSMSQKARGVGDLKIRVLNDFMTDRDSVLLESIADPKTVRDMIDRQAGLARAEHRREEHTQHVEYLGGASVDTSGAPSPQSASALSATSSVDLLTELRRRNVLDDAGFGSLVAKASLG